LIEYRRKGASYPVAGSRLAGGSLGLAREHFADLEIEGLTLQNHHKE
jgi:hypothetical protein